MPSPKVTKRKCAAIFKDDRRCHPEQHWNRVDQPFIIRFLLNLVHRLRETCWFSWTQMRKGTAIFTTGHRRHLENQWIAGIRSFINRFRWQLVHTLSETCWVHKKRNRLCAVILKINELLQFGSSSPDYEESWYTYEKKYTKYLKKTANFNRLERLSPSTVVVIGQHRSKTAIISKERWLWSRLFFISAWVMTLDRVIYITIAQSSIKKHAFEKVAIIARHSVHLVITEHLYWSVDKSQTIHSVNVLDSNVIQYFWCVVIPQNLLFFGWS
jgi:hypothetical protein